MKYDKVNIYFDTNSLEIRHSGNALFLSELAIQKDYFELEKIIVDWNLQDKVKICIPEIVWLEIKKHLKDCFISTKQSMEDKIKEYRKTFGSTIEINYEFKEAVLDYEQYLEEITNNFLSNPLVSAQIISCPKDNETVSKIITKAMHTTPPFVKVKKGSKEYTDAGFRDALIYETLLCDSENNLGILISNDTDFNELFEKTSPNLLLCKSVKEAIEKIVYNFDILTVDVIEAKIKDNEYLLKWILLDVGFNQEDEYRFDKIIKLEKVDEGLPIPIKFSMFVNNEKFIFDILYEIKSNELISASYNFFDEVKND